MEKRKIRILPDFVVRETPDNPNEQGAAHIGPKDVELTEADIQKWQFAIEEIPAAKPPAK